MVAQPQPQKLLDLQAIVGVEGDIALLGTTGSTSYLDGRCSAESRTGVAQREEISSCLALVSGL